jgi:hypothetical protein
VRRGPGGVWPAGPPVTRLDGPPRGHVCARSRPGRASARDIWLDALEGDDAQGGLEVKSWLFRLLIGRATAAGAEEDRPPAGDQPAGPGRFDAAGGWAQPPQTWPEDAGERLRAGEGGSLVTEYLEDTLPARDRPRLEAHLAGCPPCTQYPRQIRITISAAGQAGPDPPPPETYSELAALYRRWRSSQH